MAMAQEVIVIYAGTKGFFDDVPVTRVAEAQNAMIKFIETQHGGLIDELEKKKEMSEDLEKRLREVLAEFKKTWQK
jgi:F-type H+-transporting ATPase subunit alpha